MFRIISRTQDLFVALLSYFVFLFCFHSPADEKRIRQMEEAVLEEQRTQRASHSVQTDEVITHCKTEYIIVIELYRCCKCITSGEYSITISPIGLFVCFPGALLLQVKTERRLLDSQRKESDRLKRDLDLRHQQQIEEEQQARTDKSTLVIIVYYYILYSDTMKI